ncbi:hypothetical protein L1O48_09915, partial [Ligilactobacillus equi]|uniref:mucin-binding protein n=1 Tax=Ligilactobacillus equi TaxID=137357 RepID=UPI002ED0B138
AYLQDKGLTAPDQLTATVWSGTQATDAVPSPDASKPGYLPTSVDTESGNKQDSPLVISSMDINHDSTNMSYVVWYEYKPELKNVSDVVKETVKYVFDNGKKAHDDQSPADISFAGTQDIDKQGQDIGTPKWDKDSETFAGVT